MIRFVAFALILVVVISLLRAVIGLLAKGLREVLVPSRDTASGTRPPEVPLSGELKRDPVCGTYIAAATSIKKTVSGETLHFCSAACRDKHV
ncbi:MAG: hypothetical protein NTY38_10030 [Acidobacteria bacterium]|nr:hypothetical protein [Acidobacteriota bacterium]